MAPSTDVAIVIGTRPEIIKTAPVIRELNQRGNVDHFLIHTDQHYDNSLSGQFFDILELSQPDEHLFVKSGTHHEQTGEGLIEIGKILNELDPDLVIAQGDTNAVLSTALAASKLPTEFGHIEAGLRSFDRTMPEEINRVLSDAVADYAFAPTEDALQNLENEGITDRAYLTGNTIVDACQDHIKLAQENSSILEKLDVVNSNYVVATIHRPFNTDDERRLEMILSGLDESTFPVILPAHPRTQSEIKVIDYQPVKSLEIVDPLDYLDFLLLLDNAIFAVTDSGGIQEEASILETPCLTVRPNTERPETLRAGVNKLVEPANLVGEMARLESPEQRRTMTGCPDLYGDGTAGEQIATILIESTVGDTD